MQMCISAPSLEGRPGRMGMHIAQKWGDAVVGDQPEIQDKTVLLLSELKGVNRLCKNTKSIVKIPKFNVTLFYTFVCRNQWRFENSGSVS